MDVVIVTHRNDLKLLRHLLLSYKLFYKTPNNLFVFTSKEDDYLIREISFPNNTKIIYKENYPELQEISGFREQLYLKLIAYTIVTTEYFWLIDSDFLFIQDVYDQDFFVDEKPVWFYRDWTELARRWKKPSEQAVNSKIDYLYMGHPSQFVFKKALARRFAEKYGLKKLLNQELDFSEFVIYGWFVHKFYEDEYLFINVDNRYEEQPVVANVNQIPPSYCHLDPKVSFANYPHAKVVVFWSHWELAEEKMIEFLSAAQEARFGKIITAPANTLLPILITSTVIANGDYANIIGVASDGWVLREVTFFIPVLQEINLSLDVPQHPQKENWHINLSLLIKGYQSGNVMHRQEILLGIGKNECRLGNIAATDKIDNIFQVSLNFSQGFWGDERELIARLIKIL